MHLNVGVQVDAGPLDYIDAATQVEALRADPMRPYLYAIDRPGNSLLFINLDTHKVDKTIFVGSSPVDLVIDDAGASLYVANYGGSQIAVVDLATQKVARNLSVDTTLGTWHGNPYRLALTGNDTLVFTSYDQWNDLKLVSAQDGSAIVATGSLYEPGLASSPDGKALYVGESGSTGSAIHRFTVTATALTEVDTSTEASGYGSRLVVLSKDGKYAFYGGQKYLASNLKGVLGQFSETIYATNADGSIAIGKTKVFDGITFLAKASLPVSTEVMAISPNFATVYLYQITSSRIYLYDISKF